MIPRRWLLDEWREEFLVQAQLHELPGPTIGEALAEVDTHCADSGQSPQEAFGDPVSYAAALAGGIRPAAAAGASAYGRPWKSALSGLGVVGGVMALLEGVRAVAAGEPSVLTTGMLVGVAAAAAATTFIAAVVLRPGSRHRLAWLVPSLLVGLGLVVVPQLVWGQPVVQLPGWLLLAAGAILLTVAWWPLVSGRNDNPVIDPRTGKSPFPIPRWVGLWGRWGLPVLLVLVGVALVLSIVASGR